MSKIHLILMKIKRDRLRKKTKEMTLEEALAEFPKVSHKKQDSNKHTIKALQYDLMVKIGNSYKDKEWLRGGRVEIVRELMQVGRKRKLIEV